MNMYIYLRLYIYIYNMYIPFKPLIQYAKESIPLLNIYSHKCCTDFSFYTHFNILIKLL